MDAAERKGQETETAFEGVAQKLALIETYVDQLHTVAHPEALRTDVREQRFIAHTLQLAIQAAWDAATWISSAEGLERRRTGYLSVRRLAEIGLLPEHLGRALRDLNKVRNTLVHETDVDLDFLEEAFGLTPKTLLEFVQAIRPGIRPLADVSQLAATLGTLRFGRINEGLIVASLLAIREKDPERGLRQVASSDLEEALSQTRSALRKAITFLRDTPQIPHAELLPSQGILAILALLFHHHPAPTPRSRQLLTRWIWRGAIRADDRHEIMLLHESMHAIRPGSENDSVRSLLVQARKTPEEALDIPSFSFRSAQSKLKLAALAALRPRHIVTGKILDIAELCEQPGGPAATISFEESEGELAGKLLHPRVGDLKAKLTACKDPETLRSHLVSEKSHEALAKEGFESFLRSREEDLQKYIEDFLQSKAEWNASDRDRPALASLIVADE